ncbi:MAG: nicotinate-nucleotide adenylyltransferase [Gammaproteobacteria bacterium]|jgi:nicotinate-nucleotide adenylyltransferase
MIGILGGTFDPVHFGHLRPALEIQQSLELAEVRLIPCHLPPHRSPPVASPDMRVRLLEVAVKNYPQLRVDRRELGREGPSYTFDTLASLHEELPEGTFCLLIGMDAFRELPTWHRWNELIELCHMVVMTRPGSDVPQQGKLADFIQRYQVRDAADLRDRQNGGLLFQPVTQLEISASQVRSLLGAGRSAGFLLPESVIELIRQEGLYRRSR